MSPVDQKLEIFLKNLTKIRTDYCSDTLIVSKITEIEKKFSALSKKIKEAKEEIQEATIKQEIKNSQRLLLDVVSKGLMSEELCAELIKQITLSTSSHHKLQIEENSTFDEKKRWIQQFYLDEDNDNKVANFFKNECSESDSSMIELNTSGDDATTLPASSQNSFNGSLFNPEAQDKKDDGFVQNIEEKFPISRMLRTRSDLTDGTERGSPDKQKAGKTPDKNLKNPASDFSHIRSKVDSRPSTRMPRLSRSNTSTSLFSNNSTRKSCKVLELDEKRRLVILSENHPFLGKIKPERKKIPQSYRKAIRIDSLTDNEMDDLSNNYASKTIAVGKSGLKA